MRKIYSILVLFFLGTTTPLMAQQESTTEKELQSIQKKQLNIEKEVRQIADISAKYKKEIIQLRHSDETLKQQVDSLTSVCYDLKKSQIADRTCINDKIKKTDANVSSNQSMLESRTIWGGIIVLVVLAVLFFVYLLLTRKIKNGTSSIDEVRKAQDALQSAQTKMQEESVKLDNKLLELAEKQMQAAPVMATSDTTDHSLALKVADEIVRIEMNLSRMDASIKGYKQLAKAVQRIKDNFNANGYEIVDMLGKPYNAGMKVVANFVPDDGLQFGSQIITGIIKPQINYNGQMIQAAQITVSQNI